MNYNNEFLDREYPARKTERDGRFPHCEARVLHAPGVCKYCDLCPDLQAIRQAWGIAFTGQEIPERGLPCPADAARPPNSESDHRRWPGNVAAPSPD